MRCEKNINDNWLFSKEAKNPPLQLPTDWESIDLPFTWNGTDGQDGGNDYYRGKCFFAKELLRGDIPDGDEVYIRFGGVNSSAEVWFNGKQIATHDGGYSAFTVKLSDIGDKNLLVVSADNSPNEKVYPQMADFTFYGGIYRSVELIGLDSHHFDMDYYGSPGIKITPVVEGADARLTLKAFCSGCVNFVVTDGKSEICRVNAKGENPEATVVLRNVHLWDGTRDPFLYTVRAELIDNGKIFDSISARFGCRSFVIDPQRGFLLNGREYPLRGVSRHQDRPKIGNSLLPEHHLEDIELICEMGANTVRLAHYQHDQYFYDLCDERGLVVWAEIPYISKHLPDGVENTLSQMTELIVQNYNHPCIAVWGLSNEISMGGTDSALAENHRKLNDLAHRLDPTRPTTVAVLTACSVNEEYVGISDVLSYNHYFGWYGGDTAMYGAWFDAFHKKYPNRAVGLSEYGCEALNWHSSSPEQGDYTEEYQAHYHEELIKQIAERKYLWATHVWNMFDFAADARAEGGENGMNHKGLVSFDRKYKKDAFFAYKAWLSSEPMLHICSKRYVNRCEERTKITVYSNQPEVELFVNSKSAGVQKKGKYPFFYFTVDNIGESVIEAVAGDLHDTMTVRKVDEPDQSYIMRDEHSVINWFEISTPPGRLSVNDKIGDILKPLRGKIFALKLVNMLLHSAKGGQKEKSAPDKPKKNGLTVMGFSISSVNRTMIDMVKGFTLKRALMMLGDRFTKEQLLDINASLNKIKKK